MHILILYNRFSHRDGLALRGETKNTTFNLSVWNKCMQNVQTTSSPDLRTLRLNGLKVKIMNVKSYFIPFCERGRRAATGWKVKTTTTCQFATWPLWDNSQSEFPNLRRPLSASNYFWCQCASKAQAASRWYLLGSIQGNSSLLQSVFWFACGNCMTRCKPGRNCVYPSSESNWLCKHSYLLNSAQFSYHIAAVGLNVIHFRRLEKPRKHLK